MISKRNMARTKLAEILYSAGAPADRALDIVSYPKLRALTVSDPESGTQSVQIIDGFDDSGRSAGDGKGNLAQFSARPASTRIELDYKRPTAGSWAIGKTMVKAEYSDGSRTGLFAGTPQSGDATAPESPIKRTISVPPPPQWPEPGFLKAKKIAESETIHK